MFDVSTHHSGKSWDSRCSDVVKSLEFTLASGDKLVFDAAHLSGSAANTAACSRRANDECGIRRLDGIKVWSAAAD
jgi:hypothetical protein